MPELCLPNQVWRKCQLLHNTYFFFDREYGNAVSSYERVKIADRIRICYERS
jgi:hypothetical protein